MLKVIAQDFIRPEALDLVRPLYTELVRLSQAEPLCISYDLFVDQKDPGHFTFIETWPNRAAPCSALTGRRTSTSRVNWRW